MGRKAKNLVGRIFGMLTVVERADNGRFGNVRWLCKCGKCGEERIIFGSNLTRKRTKDCIKCSREISAGNILFSQYLKTALKNDRGFELDREKFDAFIKSNCYYCGCPPSQIQKLRRKGKPIDVGFRYNGIDRINSEIGYIKDNVRPCCFSCNSMKSDMSISEFKQCVTKIVKGPWYNGKRN